ncbi:hypothetical protein BKA64DRAFT_768005 [Cadophora sp. MPI-SDFR-AT-0126]|nr:hypothetical protein BKA64DRAFT_768005 [Leotiomycetes sp. MPI-SDFR-AT-0126]
MSQLAATRSQPKKPLAGTTFKVKINSPRPLCTNLTRKDSVAYRPAARGSLKLARSRYKKSQDLTPSSWTRLRCSPCQAKILRVEPYLVDDNGRSVMARIPENITPSRSSRSRSSRKSRAHMASPHTPIKQQGNVGASRAPALADGGKHVSSSGTTPGVPPPPPKDTPRPKKPSLLDKELPAKPPLRYAESPQRRDATDSAAKRMTVSYPPLRPSNVIYHRPSMSDSGSFRVTPSLDSARGSTKNETGTASTKKAQKAQAFPVTITSQRSLRQTSSAYSLSAASRGPASSYRAANLSHGHIGAYKNGSPIQRYPSTHRKPAIKTPVKFNRRNTRNFQVLSDNSSGENITIKVDIQQTEESIGANKENFDVSGVTLTEDSAGESPLRSDVDRRYVKLGVGPTVRYSKDAREVLMGKSPNVNKPVKKTSSFDSGKLLNDGPYPHLPTKSTTEVKSRFQVGDNPASRLNRPTASSTARTQESKAKIESRKSIVPPELKKGPEVKKGSKGLRSRVSNLLHGRRRCAQPVDKNTQTLTPQNKKDDIRRMTAREAVMNDEQFDKLASDRDQQQIQTNRQETTQTHIIANAARRPTRDAPLAARRNPDDNGDRPPQPPTNSTESLGAHYLEDAAALQTEDARLEAAIAGVQASLDEIIATAQGIEYPGFRAVVEPVIRSLAASILSAQNARVAVVGLGNATQRVVTDTLLMSEAISRAATQARAMIGEIQNMVPGAEVSGTI